MQLISVPVSEPLGKSDLLLALGAVHVHSLTLRSRQPFKTNFKANIEFACTASSDSLNVFFFSNPAVMQFMADRI